MKTTLKTIMVASCAVVSTAAAARTPPCPDFHQRTTDASLAPVDVIPFDFDSAALDGVDRIQIREAARWLRAHPGYRLIVEGHTDAIGTEMYNVTLATRRAEAVRAEMFKQGVPYRRVTAAIYGEAMPLAKNPRAQATRANRRVVIYATRS